MDMTMDHDIMPRDWSEENSIIKVIGVGGGGCNAVNYMYKQKIKGCNFIVCNTDSQALYKSEVPTKIQMGSKGLGAGTDPVEGRNAALESQDEIAAKVLDNGTEMLFITAGMGGGTGTGASPVIAKMAKDRGILTVAVVTIPFKNEGNESQSKAVDGIHELEKNVDSLLIINNEKLYEFFGDTLAHEAFPMADEVLATAVRGIIEVITQPGYINVDFKDVSKMMRNSGMALMGTGVGTGNNRLEDAVKGAFESPLLNDFDLKTAKNVLINITSGNNERGIKMKELETIDEMITQYTGSANRFKKGLIWDAHHRHRHGLRHGQTRRHHRREPRKPRHHRPGLPVGNDLQGPGSAPPGRHDAQGRLQHRRTHPPLLLHGGHQALPVRGTRREHQRAGGRPGHPART